MLTRPLQAGGNSGKYIAEALLKTGKHTVTAISRAESSAKLPEGIEVKHVDYNNKSNLVEALKGQDALIITMAVTAPKDQEVKLLEAAAEAGVPWVLPNEWGFDTTNRTLVHDSFVGIDKQKNQALVEQLGKSSWIAVATGFWYEWSVAIPNAFGFDFDNRTVTLFDEGETKICTSTWPQVGRAVAALLSLKIQPEGDDDKSVCLSKFRNGYVFVNSFLVNQEDILESILRVTKTDRSEWKVAKEPSKERYTTALEKLKQGGGQQEFVKVLYTRVFYPDDSGNFAKTKGLHNDLLGLPTEDIDEATKAAIQRAKELGQAV